MLKAKHVLRSATIGAIFGLMVSLVYIITGIIFQETIFDAILSAVTIFFAWPFGFLIKLLEDISGSYVGTMFGIFIAASLGGFLYGAIVGGLAAMISSFIQKKQKQDAKFES